jgi:DUF177 domain-containing protein
MPSSRRTPTGHLDPHAPLVFNVRGLSRRPGSARTERRNVPAPASLHTGMAHIPEGADLSLDLMFESVTEGVLVTAIARAPVAAECARCLEPVETSIEVESRELFSYEQGGGEGEEDGYSLDGDLLDLEPALRDALVLALPLAPRCQEDCPGLCVECGVRLAGAPPGHRHDSTIDPRWAGLRQFEPQAGPDGAPLGGALGKENGRGGP